MYWRPSTPWHSQAWNCKLCWHDVDASADADADKDVYGDCLEEIMVNSITKKYYSSGSLWPEQTGQSMLVFHSILFYVIMLKIFITHFQMLFYFMLQISFTTFQIFVKRLSHLRFQIYSHNFPNICQTTRFRSVDPRQLAKLDRLLTEVLLHHHCCHRRALDMLMELLRSW